MSKCMCHREDYCPDKFKQKESIMEYPKILMSTENPNGWKLESLLEQIFNEVRAKSVKISNSKHPQRDMILQNNCDIGELLLKAIEIQKSTYEQLDAVAPNEGPLKPRL